MKRFFFYLLVMIAGQMPFQPLYAENPSEKAKKILQESAAILKSYQGMEIRFSVLTGKDAGKKIEDVMESGNGKVQVKGQCYRIEMENNVTLFDGQALYSFNPDMNEVSVSDPEDTDDDLLRPDNLMRINELDFKFRYLGMEDGSHVVEMLPEDRGKMYSRILVKIHADTGLIRSFISFGKDGQISIVVIDAVKDMKGTLSDKNFIYTKESFPGAEVVDLRL